MVKSNEITKKSCLPSSFYSVNTGGRLRRPFFSKVIDFDVKVMISKWESKSTSKWSSGMTLMNQSDNQSAHPNLYSITDTFLIERFNRPNTTQGLVCAGHNNTFWDPITLIRAPLWGEHFDDHFDSSKWWLWWPLWFIKVIHQSGDFDVKKRSE